MKRNVNLDVPLFPSLVEHTTQVLTAYRFDGLDFGWMYPRCWQMDCSKGPASDVSGFASLIKVICALVRITVIGCSFFSFCDFFSLAVSFFQLYSTAVQVHISLILKIPLRYIPLYFYCVRISLAGWHVRANPLLK